MFCTLLVEDSHRFRAATKEMLESNFPSMQLEEAGSGRDALAKLACLQPDLVFMDIKLPDGNGVRLTRNVKSGCAAATVVILSSYDMPEYREAAFRAGADFFISKDSPTCMNEILARVEATLLEKEILSGSSPNSAHRKRV
jgi:DNA-binding NarL/FixJ family response regulator